MPSLASRFERRSTRLARAVNKRLVSLFHKRLTTDHGLKKHMIGP
jgi:hypothetical protein